MFGGQQRLPAFAPEDVRENAAAPEAMTVCRAPRRGGADGASEDELAAERAVARTTRIAVRRRVRPAISQRHCRR